MPSPINDNLIQEMDQVSGLGDSNSGVNQPQTKQPSQQPQQQWNSDGGLGSGIGGPLGQALSAIAGKQNVGNAIHGGAEVMRNLGMGFIPDTASAVTNIPNEAGYVANRMKGDPNALQKYDTTYKQNPLANQNLIQAAEKKDVGGIAKNVGGDAVSAASTLFGPQLMKATVGKVAPFLTKTGASSMATKAAANATSEGSNAAWNDISTDIRSQITKELGNTTQVKQAVNTLLSEKAPGGVESIPSSLQMSPTDLLHWRRQITARTGGGGIFANLFKGSDIEDKVASIARRVISQNLHDYAPGTQTPDKLYAFYSKIGGDIPTWAKRIFMAEAVKHAGSSLPGAKPILNALPVP